MMGSPRPENPAWRPVGKNSWTRRIVVLMTKIYYSSTEVRIYSRIIRGKDTGRVCGNPRAGSLCSSPPMKGHKSTFFPDSVHAVTSM